MLFNKIHTIFFLLFSLKTCLASNERTLFSTLGSLANNLGQSGGGQFPSGASGGGSGFLLPQIPFPFQLLPDFNSIVALFNNISSQSLNQPQSGQSNATEVERERWLGNNNVENQPIYTTLPFHGLNTSELSWLFGNLSQLVESSSKPPPPTTPPPSGNIGIFPMPEGRLGGNGTTYADLNFLTIPQLLGLFGRR